MLSNGALAPLDLTPARLALQAYDADMEASKAGIVGVSSLIAGRRVREQNTGNLPSELREAAFERATVQILDKFRVIPLSACVFINAETQNLWQRAEHVAIARVFQTSTCSAIARASSTSIPRYRTVLSNFVWPSSRAP